MTLENIIAAIGIVTVVGIVGWAWCWIVSNDPDRDLRRKIGGGR